MKKLLTIIKKGTKWYLEQSSKSLVWLPTGTILNIE